MDTALWFYSDSQQSYGPVPSSQVAAMIQGGQLVGQHYIMPQGGTEWMLVASSPFAGYLPQVAAPAPTMPAPPQVPQRTMAGKPVAKPARRAVAAPQAAPVKRFPWLVVSALVVLIAGGAGYFGWQKPSPGLPAATKGHPFVNSLGMKFVPVPGTDVLMCIHETRRQDYAAFAEKNTHVSRFWEQPFFKDGSDKEKVLLQTAPEHPVGQVSCFDAAAFCEWLGKKEGRIYRLPTDHEWCAAAGIPDDPNFDQEVSVSPVQRAQWEEESEKVGRRQRNDPFFPVMSFPPNSLGIHDLGGSVREFCQGRRPQRDQATRRLVQGTISNFQIIRGGFLQTPSFTLDGDRPYVRHYAIHGFRCVIAGNPLPVPDLVPLPRVEGTVSYDPVKLKIVDLGEKGWLLTDGKVHLQLLDNEQDANYALAMAREHTHRRLIGNGPVGYAFEYWTGDSGLKGGTKTPRSRVVSDEDLDSWFDAKFEEITGYWMVPALLTLDTEAAVKEAKAIARQHRRFSEIGSMNNKRPNDSDYRMNYWE